VKISFDEKYEYIPKWNGNEEETEQVKFYLRYLTSPERSRCIQKDIMVDGDKPAIHVNYKERELFELSVEKIENLEVNGKKITTVKDFFSTPGLSGLFDEVVNEIVARNTRQDLKN